MRLIRFIVQVFNQLTCKHLFTIQCVDTGGVSHFFGRYKSIVVTSHCVLCKKVEQRHLVVKNDEAGRMLRNYGYVPEL